MTIGKLGGRFKAVVGERRLIMIDDLDLRWDGKRINSEEGGNRAEVLRHGKHKETPSPSFCS